jgi:hypothetical protein
VQFGECFAYSVLGPFLVDEVNEILRSIHLLGLVEMHVSCQYSIVVILVYLYWWRPLKIRLHAPYQWNGASNLYVGCHLYGL